MLLRTKPHSLCLALALIALSTLSAHAHVTVLSGLSNSHTVQPGQSITGAITVKNHSTEGVEVVLTQNDYFFDVEEGTRYPEADSLPRSNAGWLQPESGRVLLEPGETRPLNYSITVPEDSDLVGTFWSVIMVEPDTDGRFDPAVDQGELTGPRMGIQTKIRYGIQIVTNIGTTGQSDISFRDRELIRDNGTVLLQVDLQNTGERMTRPVLWAEIYAEDGEKLKRIQGRRLRMYPETSVRHRFNLTELDKGIYHVLVIVDDDGEDVFAARYRIDLSDHKKIPSSQPPAEEQTDNPSD
ncbi:MAG: hypothetical protein LAT58_12415 [Opitutales bacterium]|nr:hypothetical protein [Opitutales bacterium]